jgi:hypothetical protein
MVSPRLTILVSETSEFPSMYLNGKTWNNSVRSRWYHLVSRDQMLVFLVMHLTGEYMLVRHLNRMVAPHGH